MTDDWTERETIEPKVNRLGRVVHTNNDKIGFLAVCAVVLIYILFFRNLAPVSTDSIVTVSDFNVNVVSNSKPVYGAEVVLPDGNLAYTDKNGIVYVGSFVSNKTFKISVRNGFNERDFYSVDKEISNGTTQITVIYEGRINPVNLVSEPRISFINGTYIMNKYVKYNIVFYLGVDGKVDCTNISLSGTDILDYAYLYPLGGQYGDIKVVDIKKKPLELSETNEGSMWLLELLPLNNGIISLYIGECKDKKRPPIRISVH